MFISEDNNSHNPSLHTTSSNSVFSNCFNWVNNILCVWINIPALFFFRSDSDYRDERHSGKHQRPADVSEGWKLHKRLQTCKWFQTFLNTFNFPFFQAAGLYSFHFTIKINLQKLEISLRSWIDFLPTADYLLQMDLLFGFNVKCTWFVINRLNTRKNTGSKFCGCN